MAVLEFAVKLQTELYASLDQLLENLQQQEQQGAEARELRSSLETIVSERSTIIRAEIASIRGLRDELHEKAVSDKGAGTKDLLRWLNNTIEQMQDSQIALMVGNVARMERLKLPTEDDNAYLDELLPRRAIELSGRISLALDTIDTLMNLISTTIVTFDNQQIVVPNSKVWGSTIRNVSAQDKRRVDLNFALSHQVRAIASDN